MIRFSFYSSLLFLALFASGLYLLKYDVQALKDKNARMQQQIAEEKLALDLLEAEWVYLNRPERIEKLAARYLQVVPMAPKHMVSFMDIPARNQTVAQLEE